MEDYRVDLISFFLIWIPALVIFLSLRLASQFPFGRILLLTLGGALVIAGYPLACLYVGRGMFFLEVELVTAVVIAGIWAYCRWPASVALAIFLLVFHYAVWFIFAGATGGGEILLWPLWRGALWIWEYSGLLFPILGFCCALLWAGYLRCSELERSGQGIAATRID